MCVYKWVDCVLWRPNTSAFSIKNELAGSKLECSRIVIELFTLNILYLITCRIDLIQHLVLLLHMASWPHWGFSSLCLGIWLNLWKRTPLLWGKFVKPHWLAAGNCVFLTPVILNVNGSQTTYQEVLSNRNSHHRAASRENGTLAAPPASGWKWKTRSDNTFSFKSFIRPVIIVSVYERASLPAPLCVSRPQYRQEKARV